jgi:hypothetical protein
VRAHVNPAVSEETMRDYLERGISRTRKNGNRVLLNALLAIKENADE